MEKPEWFVHALNRHDYDGDLQSDLFQNFGEMIDQQEVDFPTMIAETHEYYNTKQITELFGVDMHEISILVGEYDGFCTAVLTLNHDDIAKFEEIKSGYNNDPMILFNVSGIKVLYGIDPETGIEWLILKTEEIERFIETIHEADIW